MAIEKVILVAFRSNQISSKLYALEEEFSEIVTEAEELVRSTNGELVYIFSGKLSFIHASFFVGQGKLQELQELVQSKAANLVIFNHRLSPTQERNLERQLQCRVIDRVGLILDIFAKRAQSQEGKLQVELAQLTHLKTRLVRGYSSLKSQTGGIGLKGPGETQLEIDRRLISQRIHQLKLKINKLSKQRQVQRKSRLKSQLLIFALVGYTNTGKSSLLNLLTSSSVMAEDLLFATLDTTTRRMWLDEQHVILLVDTVGFIRDLPHELMAAFSATLEEIKYADYLLHVVDYSRPDYIRQINNVNKVLEEIGVNSIAQLILYNKIDLVNEASAVILGDYLGTTKAIKLSVEQKLGIDLLKQELLNLAKIISNKREHI